MQHEITSKGPLLDEEGRLVEPGFAKTMLPIYERSAIKAHPLRIKEWDYYYIGNEDYGIALTVADNSYMGLDSISLLDFRSRWEHTASPMEIMPRGRTGLPAMSSDGDVKHAGKHHYIGFVKKDSTRTLEFKMDKFFKGNPIRGIIELTEPADIESMVIATPFSNAPNHFYFNQKINCMPACGSVDFDGRTYEFSPATSFGVLDWGRGVWTYKNTWYWGSCSGVTSEGISFGFNIGYGFGDTSAASENMLFYDHKSHKLDQVTFNIPKDNKGRDDFMSPWVFTSNDGRFQMDFKPILDRHADTNVLLVRSNQHQVFGRYTGTATLDDGRVITIENMMGFAEKVYNKW